MVRVHPAAGEGGSGNTAGRCNIWDLSVGINWKNHQQPMQLCVCAPLFPVPNPYMCSRKRQPPDSPCSPIIRKQAATASVRKQMDVTNPSPTRRQTPEPRTTYRLINMFSAWHGYLVAISLLGLLACSLHSSHPLILSFVHSSTQSSPTSTLIVPLIAVSSSLLSPSPFRATT